MLVLENPGRFQAQTESQNLGAVHAIPTVVVEDIFWPSSVFIVKQIWGKFELESLLPASFKETTYADP